MNPEQTVIDGTIGPLSKVAIEVIKRRKAAATFRTDLEVALDLLSERITELENLLNLGVTSKDAATYLDGMVTPVLAYTKRSAADAVAFAKDNGYVS